MTEQPFSGKQCSPPQHGEGDRKGALNIAFHNRPDQLTAADGDPTSVVELRKQKQNLIPLTFGAWNVRTLMDRGSADRPESRTALIGQEFRCCNIDITASSETRLAREGELTERGSGYTFFWSGRDSEERLEAGVGFAVKSTLVDKLLGSPKGVSYRLMSLRLPPAYGKKHMTIISAYAPTLMSPDEAKHILRYSCEKRVVVVKFGDHMGMYNCFGLVLSQVLSDLPDAVYVMPSTFAHVLNLCFHFHPFIKHCPNIPYALH